MATRSRIRLRRIEAEAEGYLELGMPHHALEVLARLGDPTAFSSHALYLQGEALKTLGRHAEALVPLTEAARRAPGKIHVWLSIGWCQKRMGRIRAAIEALEEALAVAPGEAIVHYNLACYFSWPATRAVPWPIWPKRSRSTPPIATGSATRAISTRSAPTPISRR